MTKTKNVTVKVDEKSEKVSKREAALFDEEVRYIIAKIKRAAAKGESGVGHYSYLIKSTLQILDKMGIQRKATGKHGYVFTVPDKRSGAWRKMCLYGKEQPRDEKGHFIKA